MLRFAVKMLMGDKGKFLGLMVGLVFTTFIITQQSGIFVGLMTRTFGFITDTSQPDIWVMDSQVQFIDDVKPIKTTRLFQVRGIEGVAWAVPLFKGLLKARLRTGQYQICNVIGLDDATLIGGPPWMLEGTIYDLRRPDGVIVNRAGAEDKLASPAGVPMRVGEAFEINDVRASVVGICKVGRTFQSQPVIYTTLDQAVQFSPKERNLLSFVLVKAAKGENHQELCNRIRKDTGLAAYTGKQFKRLTVDYYMRNTGIPINFGVAVLLGFIIGTAIAGQTFYHFIQDNLRYFATFKAMGAGNTLLIKMVIVQALMVAGLAWGIGIGLTTLFGFSAAGTELSFRIPWWLLLTSFVSIFSITIISAIVSLAKVTKIEPAIVFQP